MPRHSGAVHLQKFARGTGGSPPHPVCDGFWLEVRRQLPPPLRGSPQAPAALVQAALVQAAAALVQVALVQVALVCKTSCPLLW